MPIVVRRARREDAPEMARLLTSLGHPTSAERITSMWSAWDGDESWALVAQADAAESALLGVLTLHRMRVLHRATGVGRLTALVVDESSRGTGIGRALVEQGERELVASGCALIEVTSNLRRGDAHAFYERLGYERTSYRFARTIAATAGMLLAFLACGGPESGTVKGADSGAASAPVSTGPTAPRDCGATTLIAEDGVGALKIGAAVADVRAACDVLRDTTAVASEGMQARTLLVRIGTDSLAAVVVDDRVRSISIESPRFRTADSLGVGTPVSRMLALPGAETFGGEGNVAMLTARHCGMSFLLSSEVAGKFAIPTIEGLRGLPASASVARVLVFACPPPPVVAPLK